MPEYLRERRSEWMKTHPLRYWYGKKRELYTLSAAGRARIIHALQNRKISPKVVEHARNLNKGKFGKKHPKWNGNKKRPFHKAIRQLWLYRQWRTRIFQRDNWKCQFCGKSGYVEADHYPKTFIQIIRANGVKTIDDAVRCNELWDCNGRTLCKVCHYKSRERNSKKFLPSKEE